MVVGMFVQSGAVKKLPPSSLSAVLTKRQGTFGAATPMGPSPETLIKRVLHRVTMLKKQVAAPSGPPPEALNAFN